MKFFHLLLAITLAVGATQGMVQAAPAERTATPAAPRSDTLGTLEGVSSAVVSEKPAAVQEYVAPVLTSREYVLAYAVLAFGVAVLGLEFAYFWKLGAGAQPSDVLLVYAMTLIIMGTMFLIVVGTSSSQLAPAFGLYGTIVGYLLGKRSATTAETKSTH